MQRGTLILTGVLAAQLALAGVLAFSSSDYGAFDAKEPVIAFEPAKIDQIAIDQTGGSSVTLKKENGNWVVPAFAGFPADATKISLFLDKLRELKKGFPVATTSEAAARFKVSDAINERRIVLSSGGKEVGKLLVGTSPSFRLANVRSGSDEIYSVTFSSYEAGTRGEDWMDREALTIPADQVASITFSGGVTLERKDNKFALAGLGEGEKPLDAKIQDAGRAALRPIFDVIKGKGPEEVAKLENPDFQFEVKKADGSSRTYKYKKEAAGGAYLFTASDRDYVFRVAEGSVAPLAEAKREKLIETAAKPAPEADPAKKSETKTEPAPASAGAQATPAAPASNAETQPAPAAPANNAEAQSAPAAPANNAEAQSAPAAPANNAEAQPAPTAPANNAEAQTAPTAPANNAEAQTAPTAPANNAEAQPAPAAPANNAEAQPAPAAPANNAEAQPAPAAPANNAEAQAAPAAPAGGG